MKQSFWQKILSWFGLGKSRKSNSSKQKFAVGKSSIAASAAPAKEPKKSHRTRTEVTNSRLYVGNLDFSTSESELEQLFSGVGSVLSAEVVTNPRTQQSKGFAFVEMGSLQEAKRAVSVLDDKEFMGRRLIVNGAREDQRRPTYPKEESLVESTVPDEN